MKAIKVLFILLALVVSARAQTTTIDGTVPAFQADIDSAPIRANFLAAETEVQGLMDRDPDSPLLESLAIYSGSGGNKLSSSACIVNSSGAGVFQCSAGSLFSINSASSPAIWATQSGAGPALLTGGGAARIGAIGATSGGELQIYEGTSGGSNKVTFQAPATLSADNTITFDSSGLIPVAEVSGAVTGPGSSTNNALALWNGTAGSTLKNSTGWTLGSSGNMAGSAATTGSTYVQTVTQSSTGPVFKASKGSAYLDFDSEGTLKTRSASADPAATITQLGDGEGLTVVNSGTIGNVASLTNGSQGLVLDPNGLGAFTGNSSSTHSLLVTQNGTGPMFKVVDGVSAGKLEVLNGGGTTITNDSSSNQAALTVTQSHATAAVASLLHSTEGVAILNDGRTSATVNASSGYALTVSQSGTGGLLSALDGSSNGVTLDTDGRLVQATNSSSTALAVTQSGSGGVASFTRSSNGLTIDSTGKAAIAVNGSGYGMTVTQSGSGDIMYAYDGAGNGYSLNSAGTLEVKATDVDATSAAARLIQRGTGGGILYMTTETDGSDPTEVHVQSRATTTTGTAGDAYTISPAIGDICHVECTAVASCTGGSCTAGADGGSAKIIGDFKNSAGTAAQISTTTTVHSKFSQSYSAGFAVSTGDIKCQVTGVSGHNLTWHAFVTYSCLAS